MTPAEWGNFKEAIALMKATRSSQAAIKATLDTFRAHYVFLGGAR